MNRRSFVQASGAALTAGAMGGCATAGAGGAEFSDPLYTSPFIDIDEWRDTPVRHRYVHGGFTGAELKFSMYFPPAEQYEGRFFHPVMHIAGNENGARGRLAGMDGDSLEFAFASGGYLVESNLGATGIAGPADIVGWRASAATATYSRHLAREMYGGGRPYGYVFGGSGGGYKTTRCMEDGNGVWDGGVPFIHGSPVSIPNVFTVQAQALRLLQGKFEGIVDAIDPGGGGDMYAGLNEEQAAALREVTRMGFPPRAWFAHERLAFNYTGVWASLYSQLLASDPSYFEDFWTQPGYQGSNPPASLFAARTQQASTITSVVTTAEARQMGLPVGLQAGTRDDVAAGVRLANLPQGRTQGADLILRSGAAAGQRMMVVGVLGDIVMVGGDVSILTAIRAGDNLEINNSNYLASQTFHRHQNPDRSFYVWDQFRDANGQPLYPQRPLYFSDNARQDGRYNGKMIVVECLMDEAAYPWQADWYRKKVQAAHGADTDDNYRLWFVDHAMHVNPSRYLMPGEGNAEVRERSGPTETRIVSYAGVLQQALRDVSAWAERGVAPPATTNYRVEEGQIFVPATARERKGIQPVVDLTANGGPRADIRIGQSVSFSAVAEAPPNTGSIVAAEWDFEGRGDYAERSTLAPAPSVTVSTTHTFNTPGTYFPVVRVSSQREGDAATPFARAQNLGRVRVVVT